MISREPVHRLTIRVEDTNSSHIAQVIAQGGDFPEGSLLIKALDLDLSFPFKHGRVLAADRSVVGYHVENPNKPGAIGPNHPGNPDFQITRLHEDPNTYLIEFGEEVDPSLLETLEEQLRQDVSQRSVFDRLFNRYPKNPKYVYSGYTTLLTSDLD